MVSGYDIVKPVRTGTAFHTVPAADGQRRRKGRQLLVLQSGHRFDLHLVIQFLHADQEFRKNDTEPAFRRPHPQFLRFGMADLFQADLEIFFRKSQFPHGFQHSLSGLRKLQPGHPGKKRDPVFLFQILDVFAEVLMGNMEFFSSGRNTVGLAQYNEIMKIGTGKYLTHLLTAIPYTIKKNGGFCQWNAA